MDYTDEKADELIAKFNLDSNTKKVWKTRGKIPDKYEKDGYEARKPLSRAEMLKQEQLKKILRNEKLNCAYLAEVAWVPRILLVDVGRDRQNMSQQELLKTLKALQQLRIQIKEVIELCSGRTQYRKIHNDALLKLLKLDLFTMLPMLDFPDTIDYGRVMHWRQGKLADISDELKQRVVDRLAVFLLETTS